MERSESPSPSSHVTDGEATAKEGREESITLKYLLLTSSNYSAWSIKMKVYMQAQGVWDAVEAEGRVDNRRDKIALAAIYQGVNDEILLLLAEKTMAKDVWTALKSMYMGADRVTRAKLQKLKMEFEALRMREGESVDEFTVWLNTVVSKMHAMGEKMDDIAVVEKVLRAITPKFLQIASTLEQFGDLSEMTAEEVFGRLKAHEERLRDFGDTKGEHALLIRAEWESKKPKKEDRAHFAEKQHDDEPALLLTEVCESLYMTQEEGEKMMFHEENMKPRLSSEELVFETDIWYLDTGASNHMTGCKKKFSDLDEKVCGRVKFGNGSIVEIQGSGTIMLQCQNGEHKLLANVYYIPKLCSNIMSLGQLEENECKIVMEGGHLRIYDRSSKHLANMRKSKNMLYVLNLKVAHPVCLMGSLGDDA
ncbi:uncharacterized protein LOC109831249 [Asparagus officinalis]|uniref:uncharacterized protein LOC109831249 n=1 Tax=Asparagus officinalis TaxID=4686 RepID=UPI00098E1417|nr:uncharacterized protein LOC109831249 [Asparagus officinalis]